MLFAHSKHSIKNNRFITTSILSNEGTNISVFIIFFYVIVQWIESIRWHSVS